MSAEDFDTTVEHLDFALRQYLHTPIEPELSYEVFLYGSASREGFSSVTTAQLLKTLSLSTLARYNYDTKAHM